MTQDRFTFPSNFHYALLPSRDIWDISRAILKHGALAVGYIVHGDFWGYRSGVYKHDGVSGDQGLHASFAIGYGPDYVLVVNSWDAWGDAGRVKMWPGELTWIFVPADSSIPGQNKQYLRKGDYGTKIPQDSDKYSAMPVLPTLAARQPCLAHQNARNARGGDLLA